MALTYDPLATSTVSGATTSISFTGISQAYTDLRLVITTPLGATTQAFAGCRVNSGTSYSWYDGIRNSSGTVSAGYDGRSIFSGYAQLSNSGSNFSSMYIFEINLYTDSTMNKPMMLSWGQNATSIAQQQSVLSGGRANATTNVTSVQAHALGDWATGTKATLYGIKRA